MVRLGAKKLKIIINKLYVKNTETSHFVYFFIKIYNYYKIKSIAT